MNLADICNARDAINLARKANSEERRRLASVGASFPERQALAVKATELARESARLRDLHWAALDAKS